MQMLSLGYPQIKCLRKQNQRERKSTRVLFVNEKFLFLMMRNLKRYGKYDSNRRLRRNCGVIAISTKYERGAVR